MTQLSLAAYETGLADVPVSGTVTIRRITTAVSTGGSKDNGGASFPYPVSKPSNLADGDDLYIWVGLSFSGGQDTITMTTGTGFTQIGHYGPGTAVQLACFYKHITSAAGEPSSYVFAWNPDTASVTLIATAFAGLTTPLDVNTFFGHSTPATTHATPGGTTTVDCYVISAFAVPVNNGPTGSGGTGGTIVAPTGTTLITDDLGNTSYKERAAGSSIALLVAAERVSTPGVLTARSISTGTLSVADSVATVAIPVAAATVTTSTRHVAPTLRLATSGRRSTAATLALKSSAARHVAPTLRLASSPTRSLAPTLRLASARQRAMSPTLGLTSSTTRSLAATLGLAASGIRSTVPTLGLAQSGQRSIAPSLSLTSGQRRSMAPTLALDAVDLRRTVAPSLVLAAIDQRRSFAATFGLGLGATRSIAPTLVLGSTIRRSLAATIALTGVPRRSLAPMLVLAGSARRGIAATLELHVPVPPFKGQVEVVATAGSTAEVVPGASGTVEVIGTAIPNVEAA